MTCPAQGSLTGFERHTKTAYKAGYDQPPLHLPSLVELQEVFTPASSTIPLSRVAFVYDGTLPQGGGLVQWETPPDSRRGNVTTVLRRVKYPLTITGSDISEVRSYDLAGHLVSVQDPRGKTIAYDWTDNCEGAMPTGPLGAFLKTVTLPYGQTQTWKYDCYLGRPVSFTGRDGTIASFAYETEANKLNRLSLVTRPSGARIRFTYDDTPNAMKVTTESDQYGQDYRTFSRTDYDGFGRVKQTLTGTGADQVTASVVYDGLGRQRRVYAPAASGETPVYDQFDYDGLGRVTRVTHLPEGSYRQVSYPLNQETHEDEDFKRVVRTMDAFGRLTAVVEDPAGLNYQTTYGYDALDNLTSVTQAGALPRTFAYDSLKRLRQAVNPERGTTNYTYDENGNLLTRTESDGTVATLSYDDLNRLVTKTYSGTATPPGRWCYDGQFYQAGACTGQAVPASRGKLTGVGSSVSATRYVHDTVGRLQRSEQATPPSMTSPYAFIYSYYLDDSVASVKYPSNKEFVQCYDALGRLSWVSKNGTRTLGDCTSGTAGPAAADYYARGVKYAGHGGMKEMQLGNGLWESMAYNNRQQPQWLRLGLSATTGERWQVESVYTAGRNNGNMTAARLTLPAGAVIETGYRYDGVNRVQRVVESGSIEGVCTAGNGAWCQEYGIDGRGNQRVIGEAGLGATPPGVRPAQFGSNNRIADAGWGYDGRGNLNQVPVTATPDKFYYDGEDLLATYCMGTSGTCADQQLGPGRTVYRYDAEGRRVEKEGQSGGKTVYAYDGQGQLAAEYGAGADRRQHSISRGTTWGACGWLRTARERRWVGWTMSRSAGSCRCWVRGWGSRGTGRP